VNQMLSTLEMIAADRLGRALARHASHRLSLDDVQGGASGLSVAIPRAWLSATQSLYLGADEHTGIAALAKAAAPAIEPGVRAAFARALAGMERIPTRLEQAVERDPGAIEQAVRALKDLEVATKVDLVGALGINLSFISTDGD